MTSARILAAILAAVFLVGYVAGRESAFEETVRRYDCYPRAVPPDGFERYLGRAR